uniref:Uncharacterized protein n=1 Tax=Anguilla anguilla TaxID=7936 RepID=A0A0E9SM25_ANGAN
MTFLVGLRSHQDVEGMNFSLLQHRVVLESFTKSCKVRTSRFQDLVSGHFTHVPQHFSHWHLLQQRLPDLFGFQVLVSNCSLPACAPL